MTHSPATLEQAFARIRIAAQADADACAHVPTAVEAVLLALLLRLLGQLERLARAWQSGTPGRHPALSRSQARIAEGVVPPRAQRTGPFRHWYVRLHPALGMRPATRPLAPPPRLRQVRAPPRLPAVAWDQSRQCPTRVEPAARASIKAG